MNAVSQLINNRRKSVKDVACLAAEGRLFHRTVLIKLSISDFIQITAIEIVES